MPITAEHGETHWLIRLEGECTVTSAAELKSRLLEGLASGKPVRFDLASAEQIDITVLQLLWAAAQHGAAAVTRVSDAAAVAARDAGFERFPGSAVQE
jgi:anti-anti-sigma regulatory factor